MGKVIIDDMDNPYSFNISVIQKGTDTISVDKKEEEFYDFVHVWFFTDLVGKHFSLKTNSLRPPESVDCISWSIKNATVNNDIT